MCTRGENVVNQRPTDGAWSVRNSVSLSKTAMSDVKLRVVLTTRDPALQ